MRLLLVIGGMLALAVSASLTPANADSIWCGNLPPGVTGSWATCHCLQRCRDNGISRCKPGAFCDPNAGIPPDLRACAAKCMAVKDASRR
jgi:hypothetical protein